MKLRICKEFEKDYSCRGIVLGSKLLNCCGHINMKVLAIDYKSETILIDGYSGDESLPTISQIKKRDNTYDIVYVKEAKGRECNLWISIDEIEKYNCEKKEEEEVTEEKTCKDLPLYDSLDNKLKEGDKVYNICLDNGEVELSTIVKDSYGELINEKLSGTHRASVNNGKQDNSMTIYDWKILRY